jgi:putative ABC transport system substrate-binding protein
MAATAGPSTGRRLVLAALAAAPMAALAQGSRGRKRLGILSVGYSESHPREVAAEVLSELAKLGYVEGKNLELLIRFPGRVEHGWTHLPRLGLELARETPDAVLTLTTQATHAMAMATKTIPVVAVVDDPVASGFATSLARPGSNVTGLSRAAPEVARKLMEVVRVAVPATKRLAVIYFAERSWLEVANYVVEAANDAGFLASQIRIGRIASAPFALAGLRAQGISVAVLSSGIQRDEYADVARAAIKERIALLTTHPQGAGAGFLASMSPVLEGEAGSLAQCIMRMFQGADPATTPIDFPRKFRFALNRRTAEAIGLKLAPELLIRADEVIG